MWFQVHPLGYPEFEQYIPLRDIEFIEGKEEGEKGEKVCGCDGWTLLNVGHRCGL